MEIETNAVRERCLISTIIWMAFTTLVIFMVIKNYYLYKSLAAAKSVRFKIMFKPMFCLLSAPILIFSLPFLILYKSTVDVILKIMYGSKYGGILDGRDSIYNLENENPVYLCYIVQCKPNMKNSFYEYARDYIYKELVVNQNINDKIFGRLKTFMGYSYLLQEELTFNDCVKPLATAAGENNTITRDDLLTILESYTDKPLPKKREGFWDVYIGTQPIDYKYYTETPQLLSYPILIRFNHTFTDANHFMLGLSNIFMDKSTKDIALESKHEKLANKIKNLNIIKRFVLQIACYLRLLYVLCLAPTVTMVNSLVMAGYSNVLHGPKLTQKKHFLFKSDYNFSNYVNTVKKIKSKIPQCTFADIVSTAISAAFREYCIKNSITIPEYIVTEAPVPPPFDPSDLKPPTTRCYCRNRLSVIIRKLPVNIDFDSSNTPMLDLLQQIKKEGSIINNTAEYEANYALLRILCDLLPSQLLKPLLKMLHNYTVMVSNVVGNSKFSVFDGCLVLDVLPFSATRGYTGLSYVAYSYSNKLQLALSIDKALVTDKRTIQCLLDGVFKHIDMLEEEIKAL